MPDDDPFDEKVSVSEESISEYEGALRYQPYRELMATLDRLTGYEQDLKRLPTFHSVIVKLRSISIKEEIERNLKRPEGRGLSEDLID